MSTTADILIIGGGVTGTSIAWQVAQRGAGRVVLLDKASIAAGASGRTGAIVRTHYTHPTLVRMALHSLAVWESFPDVVGGPAVFTRAGFLALAPPQDAAALAANVAMQRSLGVDAAYLTPQEAADIEPRMTLDGVGAAAWEPCSGYCDARPATESYAEAARGAGVDIRVGVDALRLLADDGRVHGVVTDAGPVAARTVVVAAGYRSMGLLASVNVDLPLTPIWHDLAIVRRGPGLGQPHPVVSDRAAGFFYRPDGPTTRIGTTVASDGYVDPDVERERGVRPAEAERLAGGFRRRFPQGAGVVGGFGCAYDCTPDLQPVLSGVSGIDGLYVAAGFSGHASSLPPPSAR